MKLFNKPLAITLSIIISVFSVALFAGAFDAKIAPDGNMEFIGISAEEFNDLSFSNNELMGAITMYEGQEDVVTSLLPDNNYEDDLGSYGLSYKDIYASGTLFVGKVNATSSESTINGSKICTADGANCALATTSALWTNSGTYAPYYSSSTAVTAGIGETTPDALWDINGMADVPQLIVEGHSTQTNDLIQGAANGGNVIFSITNAGNISTSGTLAVVGDAALESALSVSGASTLTGAVTAGGDISSDTNNTDNLGGNIAWKNIYASGTAFFANIIDYGTLSVSGASTFTGALTANGDIDLGNASSDTITPTARFDADLDPSTNNARDLGLYGNAWKDLYASGTLYSTDIELGASGAGDVGVFKVDSSGNVSASGTLDIVGNVTFNEDIVLGDASGDTITPTARFAADLDPSANNARDLGLFEYAYNDLFASGTVYMDTFVGGGGSSATSTMNSSLTIDESAGSVTSTIHLGGSGAEGQGGCIVLSSGEGSGVLYLFYDPSGNGIATSTTAVDCY